MLGGEDLRIWSLCLGFVIPFAYGVTQQGRIEKTQHVSGKACQEDPEHATFVCEPTTVLEEHLQPGPLNRRWELHEKHVGVQSTKNGNWCGPGWKSCYRLSVFQPWTLENLAACFLLHTAPTANPRVAEEMLGVGNNKNVFNSSTVPLPSRQDENVWLCPVERTLSLLHSIVQGALYSNSKYFVIFLCDMVTISATMRNAAYALTRSCFHDKVLKGSAGPVPTQPEASSNLRHLETKDYTCQMSWPTHNAKVSENPGNPQVSLQWKAFG